LTLWLKLELGWLAGRSQQINPLRLSDIIKDFCIKIKVNNMISGYPNASQFLVLFLIKVNCSFDKELECRESILFDVFMEKVSRKFRHRHEVFSVGLDDKFTSELINE